MSKAWIDLREDFENEDGSLPDLLTVRYGKEESVSEAFKYLRSISQPINQEVTFYNSHLGKDVCLISVESPARLVATGEADSFCLMLYGALSENQDDFPELGVWIFPKELQIYYRPGPDWTAHALGELFDILSRLSKIEDFQGIEALVPDTEYYRKFWALFERHYKQSLQEE